MARHLTFHWTRETGRALEAVLLPRRCASCHGVLTREEGDWCGPCAFSWTRCPTDPRLRFDEPGHWDHGWAWLRNGPDRLESRLVHSLKYGVRSEVGVHLGRAMASEWCPLDVRPDRWAIVPIPLHRRKQRQRGFNQSEALARGWAEVTGMTLSDVLIRPRSGRSLTRLDRRQRMRRTKGLYLPDPSLDSTWSNGAEGCLLLDDVITTGSTLASARDALSSVWKGPIGFVTLLDAIR
ncbi:MAG: ComF family protein [Flavobacteriales bacterium]